MSKLIQKGICTCGCVERAVRETSDGRIFSMVGGLGYVKLDADAEYGFRIYDEYFDDSEQFAGETPVHYAIRKGWENSMLTEGEMPDEKFDETVKWLNELFTKPALDVIMDRDQFKEVLDKADHTLLGQLINALHNEIEGGDYTTVKSWERSTISSYNYVWLNNGKFAAAKIAHHVRIVLMEQYTLVMTALVRLKRNQNINLIKY